MESNDRDEHQSPSIKLRRGGSDVTTSLVNGRWVISAAVTVFLFIAATLLAVSSSLSMNPISASFYTFVSATRASFAAPPTPPPGADVPRLAYLISGSKGDLDRLWRVLHALYHPRNLYVVHLDLESSVEDRLELVARVGNSTVFQRVGNVEVIRPSNMVTYRGPTMVANTLHACAMLLHRSREWDWFINLSASDYPLMTQDDILHVFSTLPRNVSFMEHTSRLGWKANVRGRPLIVDPGLYMSTKQDIFTVTQRRELPTAFKLYTGSAWMALTRDFLEYVVWGWESNLPRTLLMYYTNFISSPEFYFQTLLCNTPRFMSTVANHDLHHIQWGKPAGQHPLNLCLADKGRMVSSNAPFARKIGRDDPLLDAIDAELLLGRGKNATAGMFVPGGWCGQSGNCSAAAAGVDDWVLRPGPGAERLGRLMDRIVRSEAFVNDQCK